MSEDEIKRRIETAFAAGDFNLCRCKVCNSPKTEVYREDGNVVTYCDDCRESLQKRLSADSLERDPNHVE